MILFILLALALAAVKKYRISCIWHEKSLIPLWLFELTFWFFQISAWRGDYRFLPFSGWLQIGGILSLLWPIMKFELYKQAVIGSIGVAFGSMLNNAVMKANNGQMPVYPTLSRLTGYYHPEAIEAAGDTRHLLMSESTKLNFLADYIDTGYSIMSIGDLLIHGFTTLVVYGVIVRLNENPKKENI